MYRWAFFAHIVAGPVVLVLGLVLVAERAATRFARWHRPLGYLQAGLVLGVVAPSGLVMARDAAAGPVAAVGLASLAVATASCVGLGIWSAVQRRFADHRRWMMRGYILLGSAVVLRVLGGVATVAGIDDPWFDPLANWASWLGPLAIFEVWERSRLARSSRFRPSPSVGRWVVVAVDGHELPPGDLRCRGPEEPDRAVDQADVAPAGVT